MKYIKLAKKILLVIAWIVGIAGVLAFFYLAYLFLLMIYQNPQILHPSLLK